MVDGAPRQWAKGVIEEYSFHKPVGAKDLVRKRSTFTSHCAAAGRGKNSAKHDPFTHRTPTARVFAERLAMCASIYPASGARTGRALQNGLHAEREQAIGSAIGEGPSEEPPKDSIRIARRHLSPKAPRQWAAFALPLACAHAVLQCAPRARTKGRAMLRTRQSASKDAPATGQGRERLAIIISLSPVRAPPEKQMLRTRQSASKNAPATGQGRERLAIITSLSPVRAPPEKHMLRTRQSASKNAPAHLAPTVAQEHAPPPMTKGAALLPRPSCVPLAFAFGYLSAPFGEAALLPLQPLSSEARPSRRASPS